MCDRTVHQGTRHEPVGSVIPNERTDSQGDLEVVILHGSKRMSSAVVAEQDLRERSGVRKAKWQGAEAGGLHARAGRRVRKMAVGDAFGARWSKLGRLCSSMLSKTTRGKEVWFQLVSRVHLSAPSTGGSPMCG